MSSRLFVAVSYLALMTVWIYGVANTGSESWDQWLFPLIVLLQPALGFAVGRWWAVGLPVLVVPISIPAGTPEITDTLSEPLPMWFGLMYGAVVAVPLVAVGVLGRKIYGWRSRS